jgi:hypothetical protein
MAAVRLDFVPPADPDLVELRIYEAAAKEGPYTLIESVTAIGEFPGYISTYTTALASSEDDWFAVDWYDAKGGNYGISEGIKGGVQTLLGEIVQRVMIRDPTINENVIYDEAEAVLEGFLPAGTDVQDAQIETTNARERSGLTLLTQARCYLYDLSEGGQKYTVGLVSQEIKDARSLQSVKEMLRMAENMMGLSYTTILQMATLEIGESNGQLMGIDRTRLLIELQ